MPDRTGLFHLIYTPPLWMRFSEGWIKINEFLRLEANEGSYFLRVIPVEVFF
jgi:hypothetical protein